MTVTDPKTQTKLAKPGDAAPAVPAIKIGKGVTHLSLHKGVVYGTSPHFSLEPALWHTCIMHMNLRIVGAMFSKTIVSQIGKLKEKGVDQSQLLWEMLREAGIVMKRSKFNPKSKKLDDYDFGFRSLSFAGRDAEIFMRLYPRMLALIYPASVLAGNNEATKQAARVGELWDQWVLVWKLLNTELDYGDLASTTIARIRTEHASKVKVATFEYRKRWVAAVGATQGLYLHIMCAHIPAEVERVGDLRPFQTQGLEHCHKRRKKVGFDGTNRKMGERTGTMLTHEIVLDFTSKLLSDHQYSAEHEKLKRQKSKRLTAKIERTNRDYPDLA